MRTCKMDGGKSTIPERRCLWCVALFKNAFEKAMFCRLVITGSCLFLASCASVLTPVELKNEVARLAPPGISISKATSAAGRAGFVCDGAAAVVCARNKSFLIVGCAESFEIYFDNIEYTITKIRNIRSVCVGL